MAVVRIPVSLWRDPRVRSIRRPLRLAALGAWLYALCHTREQELDGFCPRGAIDYIAGKAVIDELVRVGLLAIHEEDGRVTGYVVSDYSLHNDTRFRLARRRAKWIPDWLRRLVLERDGNVCGICGEPIAPGQAVHIDHVVALAKGGRTVAENLQPAHAVCNIRKGAR